jgi:tRNA(Ile)-lysidine synthase
MKWRNPSPACKEIELIRPLLSIPKAALRDYALQNKVGFREDATNRSLDIQRNRIRHELLPLLRKKYQPAIVSTVLRVGEIVMAEAEHVNSAAQDWLKSSGRGFGALPVAVQRRVLQMQLHDRGMATNYEMIEKLRTRPGEPVAVEQKTSTFKLRTPKRLQTLSTSASRREEEREKALVVLRDENGMVRLQLREIGQDAFRNEIQSVSISKAKGQIEFGGARIDWVLGKQKGTRFPKFRSGCEFFDANRVGSEITLRHWRPGDRFQPIGMPVAAKVQDLFVNEKVPKKLRKGLIVATTASGEVFWVEKLRISERFRLHPETKRRLQWHWRRD